MGIVFVFFVLLYYRMFFWRILLQVGVEAAFQKHPVKDPTVIGLQILVSHCAELADPRGLRRIKVWNQIVSFPMVG